MAYYHVVGIYTEKGFSNITDLAVDVGREKMLPIAEAIQLIKDGHGLYTEVGGIRTPVRVVDGPTRGTYLRTVPNSSIEDNLLSLPRR